MAQTNHARRHRGAYRAVHWGPLADAGQDSMLSAEVLLNSSLYEKFDSSRQILKPFSPVGVDSAAPRDEQKVYEDADQLMGLRMISIDLSDTSTGSTDRHPRRAASHSSTIRRVKNAARKEIQLGKGKRKRLSMSLVTQRNEQPVLSSPEPEADTAQAEPWWSDVRRKLGMVLMAPRYKLVWTHERDARFAL